MRLPLELVLVTLEWAARTWIDVHPRWTASLQLVSHAAQAAIEPIIYSVFVIQSSEWQDRADLWNQARDAELLAWILANDAPRVSHLILGENALAAARTSSAPTRSFERLSIVTDINSEILPHDDTPLKVTSTNTNHIIFGQVQVGFLRHFPGPEGHKRFWRSRTSAIGGAPAYNFVCIDDVQSNTNLPAAVSGGERWFYFELGKRTALSTLVLQDIAGVLQSTMPDSDLRNAQIVIVCPVGYTSPWGLGVDETIQMLDSSRMLPVEDRALENQWCAEHDLSVAFNSLEFRMLRNSKVDPDVLYGRVHVSHALWGCDGSGSVGLWYGRAVERGDAWDEGRLLRRFVANE